MDVAIDHSVADSLVSQMDSHVDSLHQTWLSSVREFEDLKGSGAMMGAASEACQLAVQRTNEHLEMVIAKDKQLFEDIRAAHADDLHTEEESASMFSGLGNV
ncbi:hypothetical protein KL864_31135 [Mycolicibacterium goodii]|uniref:hypothetical protein n=1 Tax=Mycolicibacterium goodii TaxID=134601 RepID=UPI001BDD48BE|nr:hypothetical protein [Mycolicibacterium goodii]MBU8820337.1 hypothetical protein [Mycolicibacterium goodii]